jgi:hypothetical protein
MRSKTALRPLPALGLVALVACLGSQVPAQTSPDSSRVPGRGNSAALFAAAETLGVESTGVRSAPIFASLERAWVVGNADSVLEHFGKRKVYISLPDGGPDGGLFSRAQSYFILKGFFDTTRTEEFSFVSIRQLEDPPGTAVGRAERTFRKRDSSRLLQDRLFVSLVQEDDHWVVAEIKSVR